MKTTIAILILSTGLLFADSKLYRFSGTVQAVATEGALVKLESSVRPLDEMNSIDPFKDQIILLTGSPAAQKQGDQINFATWFDTTNVQRISGYAVMAWGNPSIMPSKPVTVAANPSTNAAPSLAIQKAKISPSDASQQTVKVISKTPTTLIVTLCDSQGVHGVGSMGYSLINAPPSKPKKALTSDSDTVGVKKEFVPKFTVIDYPNITRVMIGSTLTFKGVKNIKAQTITYVE